MRDRRFRREEPAAVGERIGRNVHHAHHQGLVECAPEATAPQKARVVLLYAVGAGAVSPCATPSLAGLEGFCEPPEGLGGRGGLPSMMSEIWSASIVSHSSSALVIASTLSRLSSKSLRATRYCWSMMRRISASTFCMVASDTFLCVWIERPRKISPSFSP